MKKNNLLLSAVVFVAVSLFSGCLLTTNLAPYRSTELTPENSVVIYGGIYDSYEQVWTNDNPNLSSDKQKGKEEIFVSLPVECGSKYYLAGVKGHPASYSSTFSYSINSEFDAGSSPLLVEVPKEPGLYFFGTYKFKVSGIFSSKYSIISAFVRPSDLRKENIYCLKEAKKYYKGTVWEAYIDQEIQRLKNEK